MFTLQRVFVCRLLVWVLQQLASDLATEQDDGVDGVKRPDMAVLQKLLEQVQTPKPPLSPAQSRA